MNLAIEGDIVLGISIYSLTIRKIIVHIVPLDGSRQTCQVSMSVTLSVCLKCDTENVLQRFKSNELQTVD